MGIAFANSLRDQKFVSQHSVYVLEQCMKFAEVTKIIITSTYRSPEDQARVMLSNLRPGPGTMYAGAGADVEKIGKQHVKERGIIQQGLSLGFDPNKRLPRFTQDRAQVEQLMAARIHHHESLLGAGCVSHHQKNPAECNVLDVDPSSISQRGFRKFVSALTQSSSVSKIGLPGSIQPYHPKHFRESARCLHVEIPQLMDRPDPRTVA
jgi:hypothetical protein